MTIDINIEYVHWKKLRFTSLIQEMLYYSKLSMI